MTAPVLADGLCLMQRDEADMLWDQVVLNAPHWVLEIGTNKGGSALVICDALRQMEYDAHLITLDPCDNRDPDLWAQIEPTGLFINQASPSGTATAYALAGALFDLVFIDGHHSLESVRADIDGVLPVLRVGSVILFHDAHYDDVRCAIDEAVKRHALRDDGLIAGAPVGGPDEWWGGLRRVMKP